MNAKICFIGAGNMAQSLIGGLITSGYDRQNIIATDPTQAQRNNVTERFGINCYDNNATAISIADIVVLAIKPQVLESVCQEINPAIQSKKPLVISVAAGIRTDAINQWLGNQNAIVRTMPNTPSLIQAGATGLYANTYVTEEQKSQAEHIMRAVGLAVWVDEEKLLDSVTALSGSGPAYYFLFMEAMEEAGRALGLDEKTAHILTLQTAIGASKMALESNQSCANLRHNVTSPNGTTERAIQSFESAEFKQIIANAMEAAYKRAGELADELGGKA